MLMSTPSITPAQIGALTVALGGQAVAFGLLSGHTEQLVVSIGSWAIAGVWKLADAWIRHGRSKAAAVQLLEQLATKTATPPAAP